jgi:hypothetical protein
MHPAAFILPAQANKRAMRKRIQFRLTEHEFIEVIDLDKAKIETQAFPYLFTARAAPDWECAQELCNDLMAAAAHGEALVAGEIIDTGLARTGVPRTAICAEYSGTFHRLLPIDCDGVELFAQVCNAMS